MLFVVPNDKQSEMSQVMSEVYRALKRECDGQTYSIGYDLPAYGVAVFRF